MSYDTITNMGMSFGNGNENPSGVAEVGYFIPLAWFAAAGLKTPTEGTTAESLIEITANHVLAAGKSPIAVTPMFEKSGISWQLSGESLSKIFETGAEVFVPDNSAKSLGTAAAIKNYRGILLIEKGDGSGHFWQLGSEAFTAKVTNIAGGTGQGPTGEVGSRVTFQSFGKVPVFVYKGEVPAPGA